MDKEYFYQLVTKRLSKTATQEEESLLKDLLQQDDHNEYYQWIESEWHKNNLEVTTSRFNYHRAHSLMESGIREHEPEFGKKEKAQHKRTFLNYRYIAAASVLLFIGIGVALFYPENLSDEKAEPIAWSNYSTRKGHQLKITMSDGTRLRLNGNSTVRFPSIFPDNQREVFISGEAYFEVAKNPDKPFFVNINDFQIRVLGTTFNVNAYENKEEIEISLVEGSIQVGHKDSTEKVVLQPNYQIAFNKTSNQTIFSKFNLKKITGWQNKEFVFENEQLTDVLKVLENNYEISFSYDASSLKNCRVNTEFNDDSIWTILEALKYATGIDYESTLNNEIKLSGSGC